MSRSKRTDRWQVHYGTKQQQLGAYRGCFQHDRLSGHAGAVRCVVLQPAHNLLVTGNFWAVCSMRRGRSLIHQPALFIGGTILTLLLLCDPG